MRSFGPRSRIGPEKITLSTALLLRAFKAGSASPMNQAWRICRTPVDVSTEVGPHLKGQLSESSSLSLTIFIKAAMAGEIHLSLCQMMRVAMSRGEPAQLSALR
jgi:hypothetical protein